MKQPRKTPPFHDPHGEPVPGSIAEIKYLRLGGIDQWTMIRGERVTNPPLLLLHSGPGISETSLQRAAGKELHGRLLGSTRRRQIV
jgi:hypothetical protein